MSPRDVNELAAFVAEHSARAQRLPTLDLRHLSKIVELTPEDMTVTAEAGITLAALQARLAEHRQWLPIDPPNADRLTIHDVLALDLSGPRRFGCGTIREHLIGMKVLLADGRVIKSGGKVVKNVAGYDLAKLFIGSRGTLGVIVEATFKLRPLPEAEQFVSARVSAEQFSEVWRAVMNCNVTPQIFDAFKGDTTGSDCVFVLGFAGGCDEVSWQLDQVRSIGFATTTTLEYESHFWNAPGRVERVSTLPSRLALVLGALRGPWVARAGNGVVYHRDPAARGAAAEMPLALMRRVKEAYDPKNLFPEFAT